MNLKIHEFTNKDTGLDSSQVVKNKKNIEEDTVSKTYNDILKEHVFTFFNGINVLLAFFVILTGSYRNMLFMMVVIINTIIGFVQEVRSKKILDDLSIVNQQKIKVLRESKVQSIPIEEIVENDILIVQIGDQIPCDCVVVDGQVECDESMLTGESNPIVKSIEDTVLSGGIIVSGKAKVQAVVVGQDTYIHSILKDAKRTKRYPSQLRDSIQLIIRFSTIVLIPAGLLLFAKQYFISDATFNDAILSTVAAVVGMIPEGLVLLVSIALSLGVIKLARQRVLVQELYCIETLARIDTLCLDKTGTITEGKMKVVDIDCLDNSDVHQILADIMSSIDDENATAQAIRSFVSDIKPLHKAVDILPFSSDRKASGAIFEEYKYVFGAYSFLEKNPNQEITDIITDYSNQGYRSLVLGKTTNKEKTTYDHYEIIAILLIQDVLRKDAKQILSYFKKQDVDIKIISGDDPNTVKTLAKQVGIQGNAIDMRDVKNIPEIVENYSIFGRVNPSQKKEIVQALKAKGHCVAMTGDGVNDVLALKEADCSIAMGSGSEATKNISSIVLLDNQFTSLPNILKEGRRVINNIQRTASLFLVKTLFSVGLTILTLVWLPEYPFEPIQLTLISSLATGIPSFVLTLEPNFSRVKGNFLKKVFKNAIPGATALILSVVVTSVLRSFLGLDSAQFKTISTLLAGFNAISVLARACIPMTKLRKALVTLMFTIFVLSVTFLKGFYSIASLSFGQWFYVCICWVAIPFVQAALHRMMYKITQNKRGN